MLRFLPLLLLQFMPLLLVAQTIIPTPRHYRVEEGSFRLDLATPLSFSSELRGEAAYLMCYLPLVPEEQCSRLGAGISLQLDLSLPEEGYRLQVSPDRIEIVGGSRSGLFYGVQSLLQLLPPEVYGRSSYLPLWVPCCTVEDAPRFAYRASHLDVARTWIDKERVKQHIDRMAYHKLNTLHWHLTDDEGWRIEILSHPELACVGGFRGGDSPIEPVYGRWEERYGGYYTQEEIREVVAYAAERHITIIPEVDLPGHSRTMARVHPEILCPYDHSTHRSAGYDLRNVWCAAREENYRLLEDILHEVCDLFPAPYIHIGGDEVDFTQWEHCPECQALMQHRGLKSERELQAYFMDRLVAMLRHEGRKPVVWNEAVAEGRLDRELLVHGWESVKACREALAAGYPTVVMPGQYFYFDMRQSEHEEGHVWAAIFDAEKVYNFDLDRLGFSSDEQRLVAGFEGTFFSEAYLGHDADKPDYLDFMLWPRTVALAELTWHYGPKDWPAFKQRLVAQHYARLEAMGIHYRLFPPRVKWSDGELSASVEDSSTLYYMVDPSTEEQLYTSPIPTQHPAHYRFVSRLGGARSPRVAHPAYYRTITPALSFTSSMTSSQRAPFSRLESYKGAAWTVATHQSGDWMQFTFAEPLSCREILLQTGYLHLPRCIVRGSRVELHYADGRCEELGPLQAGQLTIRPEAPVRALRLVATATGNGEERVIIQPLKIRR